MASSFTDELRAWKETATMSDDARRKVWLMHTAAARIETLESHLRGIVNNWYEFGQMMLENKADYGLDERISHAHELLKDSSS